MSKVLKAISEFEIFEDKIRNERYLIFVSIFCAIFAIGILVPSFSIPLGIFSEGDAVDYRMPLVKWIARHNAYPNWDWTMVDDYPLLGDLLMVLFYRIDPLLVRIVPVFGYVLIGVAGGAISTEVCKNSKFSNYAVFLVGFCWSLTFRPIAFQANAIMVDNLAAGFLMIGFYFSLSNRAYLAGAFAAAAMATRYTMWFPAFLLIAVIFYEENSFRSRLKQMIKFVLVASLGAIPFMIRNFYYNGGNPFYPIGNSKFMGLVGTEIYGRGAGFKELILFPWDFLYTNTFKKNLFDYTVGKLFYIQLAGAISLILLSQKWKGLYLRRITVICFGFSFLSFLAWFKTGQQLRFLVPSLLILQIYLLQPFLRFKNPIPVLVVTALGILSVLPVQGDVLLQAFGYIPGKFNSAYLQTKRCFETAGVRSSDSIGWAKRGDGAGFFDQDFSFFEGNPYFLGSNAPKVTWIYGRAQKSAPGYAPWPKENPCILKLVTR
jgi:hypothetical protein